jgi:hypothetical protein
MTNKEIAEWFEIKPNSFTQHKKKKLEELKHYASFEEVYGGVEIKAIYRGVYNKKDNQIRQIYEQGFEEVRQPIDTVSHINEKIYEKYYDKLPTLSSAQSGYHYAIEVRNANYGIPFKDIGAKGCCYYLWCKVEQCGDETYYIQFNEEEDKIKQKLLKKHFGTDEEKDILIAQMVDAGEISEAEAYRLTREYRGLNNAGFFSFIKALEKEIGSKVVKATKFEEILYFDEKDKPAAIAAPKKN